MVDMLFDTQNYADGFERRGHFVIVAGIRGHKSPDG